MSLVVVAALVALSINGNRFVELNQRRGGTPAARQENRKMGKWESERVRELESQRE